MNVKVKTQKDIDDEWEKKNQKYDQFSSFATKQLEQKMGMTEDEKDA